MRRFVQVVFDEWVYATAAYTSDSHEELLASVEQLSIQAVADAVSGSSVRLTVTLQSSSDGVHWTDHGDLIDAVNIAADQTNVAVGTYGGGAASPPLRRARFEVSLLGTSPQARVRLVACGRDTSRGAAAIRSLPTSRLPFTTPRHRSRAP